MSLPSSVFMIRQAKTSMEQAGSRMLYFHRESPSVTTPTKSELLRSTLEQKPTLDYGTAGEPNCNLHCSSEESDSVSKGYYCKSWTKQS